MSLLNTCKAWRVQGISMGAKMLLLKLADCSNEKTGQCFPSMEVIMRDTGLGRSSAFEKMKELHEKGLVKSQTPAVGPKQFFLFLPQIENDPVQNLDSVQDLDSKVQNLDSRNKEREVNGNTPLPPKGDGKRSRGKRLTQAQKGRIKVKENTPLMELVGKLLGRKKDSLWNLAEEEALIEASVTEQEVESLNAYYLADIPKLEDIRRKDILTLLNHWNGELDRARSWKAKNK